MLSCDVKKKKKNKIRNYRWLQLDLVVRISSTVAYANQNFCSATTEKNIRSSQKAGKKSNPPH